MAAVLLFWNANMAAVTSCENALLVYKSDRGRKTQILEPFSKSAHLIKVQQIRAVKNFSYKGSIKVKTSKLTGRLTIELSGVFAEASLHLLQTEHFAKVEMLKILVLP